MTSLSFVMEWALRSAMVVCAGALLMKALGVKDASVRLAGWTAILFGSLMLPLLTPALPRIGVPVMRTAAEPAVTTVDSGTVRPAPVSFGQTQPPEAISTSAPMSLATAILLVYLVGAVVMILRLVIGLALGRRLRERSLATGGQLPGGVPILESAELTAPATLGILRPAVVLPTDWRDWEAQKLDAVLAHERSHIVRYDPAVQLASALHRALLWVSPLSWMIHNRIVRLAEEASDDDALAVSRDRVFYAEVLLEFVERGIRRAHWAGVAMARYGKADERIHRVLDSTVISRGVTRAALLGILICGAPLVYLAATLAPQAAEVSRTAQAAAAPRASAAPQASAVSRATASAGTAAAAEPEEPQAPAGAQAPSSRRINRYVIVSKDSMSGSWDSRDRLQFDEWKTRYGTDFVWFRHDGTDYIVTDAHVLDQLHDAMAPQREVNKLQGEVNRHQGGVNQQQGVVNADQGEVNRLQGEVNARQQEVNTRERNGSAARSDQEQVNRMQSDVNQRQAKVNEEQDWVNSLQKDVNVEQSKVNAEQRRILPIVEQGIQAALEGALASGVARPVR